METPRLIQRIVLATDGSEHAEAALDFANAFDWPPGATTIWITSIVDVPAPSEPGGDRPEGKGLSDWRRVLEIAHDAAREQAGGTVAAAARRLRERHPGVVFEEVVRVGEPAAELLAQINEVEAELVIAGARGHTIFHGLLLGSVSEALVTSAPCPVLIVREAPMTFDTVLIAVRTPGDADRLADLCLRLPLPSKVRLVAVTVSTPTVSIQSGHYPFTVSRLDQLLREQADDDFVEAAAVGRNFIAHIEGGAPGRTVEAKVIRGIVNPTLFDAKGDIAPAILREAAEQDAALTLIGARESGGLTGRLGLGSVSRKLVRRAPGAVLVVREPAVGL